MCRVHKRVIKHTREVPSSLAFRFEDSTLRCVTSASKFSASGRSPQPYSSSQAAARAAPPAKKEPAAKKKVHTHGELLVRIYKDAVNDKTLLRTCDHFIKMIKNILNSIR